MKPEAVQINFNQKINLFEVIHRLLSFAHAQGHATALWKLPESNQIQLVIDEAGSIVLDEINLEESKPGFIFAPFNTQQKTKFVQADVYFVFDIVQGNMLDLNKVHATEYLERANQTNTKLHFHYKPANENYAAGKHQDEFIELVKKSIEKIEDGLFEKVVPSRCIQIQLNENADILNYFTLLAHNYPNTLVSLVSIPGTGTWLGASPEMLVSISDKRWFHTVALAGTQAYNPELNLNQVSWTQKEIEEQALVSRYIINCFKKIRLREFEEHGPKSVKAANLIHLKTEFKVDMVETNFPQLGSVMLKLLHPTSAVCGMPLQGAMDFILSNENYNREFYSGFLGPVNFADQTNIYVNLRCLQFFESFALCYAGAGITIDSDPENEFQETEMKMNTMLNILNH